MSFAKMIFTTIDKVLDNSQNPSDMQDDLKDVVCLSDIPYTVNFPEMALDLYFLPKDSGTYPVILEIHGGGFSAGDKKYRRTLCRYLAKYTGAAVVNVNYGVGKKYACPIPMQNLADAVNFTRDNAEKYRLDTSKFVVTGDSAGAFYAAFLAELQYSRYLQELFECKLNVAITAAVLNCGIYDIELSVKKFKLLAKGVCKEMTGMCLKKAQKSRYFPALNLCNNVTSDFPPTLLIYSENDFFCRGQGEKMKKCLEENNVETQCVSAESIKDNHTYSLMWVTDKAKEANEKILQFLNKHFEK